MTAEELVTDEIPPLKTSDSGIKALSWMDEFKVSHMPIVDKGKYIGIISDSEILDLNSPDAPIGNNKIALLRPFALNTQHVYEVLQLVYNLKLTIVPVIDADEKYLGLITLPSLMDTFALTSAVQEPGGVVILELNVNDYSLSHIAQIVEGNDAKIISSYVTPHQDSTKMELTLKINRTNLSPILQSFERFDYTIKASFHHSSFDDDMKNRFDEFMNYLNI